MNRWNPRIWIGAGLVLLGLLMLIERLGILHGLTGVFFGLIFVLGGAYFLYRFMNNTRGEWWAVIPGLALVGIGVATMLSGALSNWAGFFLLGAFGLSFFAVYWSRRDFWWAIIPGGVFATLAFITLLGDVFHVGDAGGLFFVGLGLTFVLVAVLASLHWAWIPGILLLVMGALIGTPFLGSMNLIWPIALIVGGLLLIFQFARKR